MTRAKSQSSPSSEIKHLFSLRSWRPFGEAQDRLGARNILEFFLVNILSLETNGGTPCV